MRMTCDGLASMGYIYLMPPAAHPVIDTLPNDIIELVPEEKLHIPYISAPDEDPAPKLDRMRVAELTYREDFGKGYDTPYGNDMDKNGYIIGIESDLTSQRLAELLNAKAFQVIDMHWRGRDYHLLTLDTAEKVFDERNTLYRMSDLEDVFVIVNFGKPKIVMNEQNVVLDTDDLPLIEFRGFLSSRDDLYPLDFLLKSDFRLSLKPPDPEIIKKILG
ncbi:hypothetical protein CDO73_09255 [Saccharibacillus sp. O23]|uniref:hypothetical protein n=1 Tax=Saccharibacillus sp. O23 TaxID=2009338 RepID=UPI000B4E4510|nr:hypothetical protein [Saccharibacillus sp. O23]OWR30768.1 hypothetical protein CDO73_09255 [Saccharibacillus sp. O23]